MIRLVFDTDKKGLETVFKSYQSEVIRLLHEKGELSSGQADKALKDEGIKISRASVIFFLNDMVDEGYLTYTEKFGKGGARRVYKPAHDSFADFIKSIFYRFENHLNSELGAIVGIQTGEQPTQDV